MIGYMAQTLVYEFGLGMAGVTRARAFERASLVSDKELMRCQRHRHQLATTNDVRVSLCTRVDAIDHCADRRLKANVVLFSV